ncbi:MAG: hypothetical protein NTW55_03995 [Planctomycetota bacterium]|nr:hypothetical protein [Planctomycetota bacterium]
MEKHFLSDYVEGSSEFRPEPWYNQKGDCIVYQTANEAIVADRIDEFLTIYSSAIDERPIGFQIKGVRAIIKAFGLDGLAVKVEKAGDQIRKISLIALLLAAYEQGPQSLGRRKAYVRALSQDQGEVLIDEPCFT